MIEAIRSLSIKGKCFQEETILPFYKDDKDKITLIYGKNGSGKSTISKGIAIAAHRDDNADLVASLLDRNGNHIDFSESENVFVFNEKYIDENIKINDDGLGTIVLLGEQVELQSEIDRYEELLIDSNKDIEKSSKECELYKDENNTLSPLHYMNIIERTLKRTGGWAETDAKIKDNKQNTAVTKQIKDEFLKLSPSNTETELKSEYKEKWDLFSSVSAPNNEYSDVINKIYFKENIDDDICGILSRKIEETRFTDREKLIFSVITNGRQQYVEDAHREFTNQNVEFCPYCYQPLDEQYKNELIKSIERVLNKDVENHKQELNSISFPELNNNYERYSALDKNLTEAIIKQKSICENIILQYKNLIIKKRGNIYQPIENVNYQLEKNIIILNNLLEQLENKRVSFNKAAKDKKQLQKKLIEINKAIAYFEIESAVQDYKKQNEEFALKQEELKKKEENRQNIIDKLGSLKQRQSQKGLATKNINHALSYVFYSQDRLSIEFKNDKYYLKSNGRHVKPEDISTGERNIIALCYFFTYIASNQEISKLYSKEMFVVIDDPVSSFDFENKVGISSLLRYSINMIVGGNPKSKILIFSHDLTTIFDIQKAVNEIRDSRKGNAKYSLNKPVLQELKKGRLDTLKFKPNEYGSSMKNIYDFIKGNTDSITIGNTMRRVLEAFSTFIYQKSIDNVSYEPNVLSALGDYSIYFENLMYRLILNGESHFEEQIYNIYERKDFFEFISDDEKKRTAKDILCFMYILNHGHIEAYLPEAVQDIKKWQDNIIKNISFKGKDIKDEETTEPIATNVIKRKIKLYDLPLSAGIGNDILEDDMSSDDYYTDNKICDFALRIEGDSMKPKIPNGSIVLIKKCDDIESGKIGAFFYNGSVFCKKKICREDGTKWLVSLNKDYNDFKISEDDIVKVYGEVIEVVQ